MTTTTIMPVLAELVSAIERINTEWTGSPPSQNYAEDKAKALAKAAKALAQASEEEKLGFKADVLQSCNDILDRIAKQTRLPHIKPIEGKLADAPKA